MNDHDLRLARELLAKATLLRADARARVYGWKGLALFLRVSLRTARRLASRRVPEDFRLPVSRMVTPGKGARVFAFVDELEAWERRIASSNRVATND